MKYGLLQGIGIWLLAAILVPSLLLCVGTADPICGLKETQPQTKAKQEAVPTRTLTGQGTPFSADESVNASFIRAAELGLTCGLNSILDDPAPGFNIDAKDHRGETAEIRAAAKAHPDVVRLLKDHGAVLTLFGAAILGDEGQLRRLVSKDPEVNARTSEGLTPLMIAARSGHMGIVSILLAKGADPNAEDERGVTPLLYAGRANHDNVVKLLRAHGAKYTVPAAAALGDWAEVFRLIAAGSDPNEKGPQATTALMYAAMKGDLDAVRRLTEQGAAVNAENRQGDTPLNLAARCGRTEMVRYLLRNGSLVNATNFGSSLLCVGNIIL